MYISPYCRLVLVTPNFIKFGIRGQLTDVITCVKFLVNRFRGYGVLIPPKLQFPIELLRRPYNSVRTAVRHCDEWRSIDWCNRRLWFLVATSARTTAPAEQRIDSDALGGGDTAEILPHVVGSVSSRADAVGRYRQKTVRRRAHSVSSAVADGILLIFTWIIFTSYSSFTWFDAIRPTAYKQIVPRLTTALTDMQKIQLSLHYPLSDVFHSALR